MARHAGVLRLDEILAWVLLAAVVLHVMAALRHHYVKRNDILRRMIWIRRGSETV